MRGICPQRSVKARDPNPKSELDLGLRMNVDGNGGCLGQTLKGMKGKTGRDNDADWGDDREGDCVD